MFVVLAFPMLNTGGKMRCVHGFTLLELLVVMFLASMTVALVGAGASSFMERSQYHQSIQEVTSALNTSRALAVREGRTVLITFDPIARVLSHASFFRYTIPTHLDVRWAEIEGASKDAAMPVVFVFNPDGSGYGSRFEVLRGGRGVSFRLNWLLGTVEQDEVAGR